MSNTFTIDNYTNNPNDKFLKLSPSLFTQEKLHNFESLGLYSTIIKYGATHLEDGERLKNISWRILNKSLLKDKNINRSKKREGVKSMYYILDPMNKQKQTAINQPRQIIPVQRKHAIPTSLPQPPQQKLPEQTQLRSQPQLQSKPQNAENENVELGSKFDSDGKVELARQDSLFGNMHLANQPNSLASKNDKDVTIYFSSDDDSDWDTLSEDNHNHFNDDDDDDDDSLYDYDEDEEKYYKSQWDNLVFSKNTSNPKKKRNSFTPDSGSNENIKKSLLSGLFSNKSGVSSQNESSNSTSPIKSNKVLMSSLSSSKISSSMSNRVQNSTTSLNKPTIETSNVTVTGSLSPPTQGKKNTALETQLLNQTAIPKRGSFSSNISGLIREKFAHQSNAPPSAQTLLPTALSTHMFLPNNVRQQRMAASTNEEIVNKPTVRRESMNIPSRNKNIAYIKTRMEITEEEKLATALSRQFRRNQPNNEQ